MRGMEEPALAFWLSALLTGLAFGYVIQRGGFCLTRAISNVALMGDAAILRAYVLALLVAAVGVQLLVSVGLVEIPVRPFRTTSISAPTRMPSRQPRTQPPSSRETRLAPVLGSRI